MTLAPTCKQRRSDRVSVIARTFKRGLTCMTARKGERQRRFSLIRFPRSARASRAVFGVLTENISSHKPCLSSRSRVHDCRTRGATHLPTSEIPQLPFDPRFSLLLNLRSASLKAQHPTDNNGAHRPANRLVPYRCPLLSVGCWALRDADR